VKVFFRIGSCGLFAWAGFEQVCLGLGWHVEEKQFFSSLGEVFPREQ
jgi:hypothetical protein